MCPFLWHEFFLIKAYFKALNARLREVHILSSAVPHKMAVEQLSVQASAFSSINGKEVTFRVVIKIKYN